MLLTLSSMVQIRWSWRRRWYVTRLWNPFNYNNTQILHYYSI